MDTVGEFPVSGRSELRRDGARGNREFVILTVPGRIHQQYRLLVNEKAPPGRLGDREGSRDASVADAPALAHGNARIHSGVPRPGPVLGGLRGV